MSSTAAIGMTSRTVEAMKASSAARDVVERAGALRDVALLEQPRAGDRGEDVVLERRREQLAARDPEERPRRALEHAAVRRDEQRLVEAALLRQPAGEHVAPVGERLEPVEDAPGGERHRRHARHRRALGERLDHRDPAPSAGQHHAQEALDGPARVEQRGELGLERLVVGVEPQALARVAQAVEVVAEGERAPGVQAHDLEGAVTAQEALVGDGDAGLAGGPDLAVYGGERHCGEATEGLESSPGGRRVPRSP